LIGGAIGDALGWPVEFLSYAAICDRYGKGGIQKLVPSVKGKAGITDDTQMTLFTAEGILRSESRIHVKGICHVPSVVYYAYQRWLVSQAYDKKDDLEWIYDGWLFGRSDLHAVRSPGNSCLSALASGNRGSLDKPINKSKGCGAIMRSAPFGLMYGKEMAFQYAAECAALTHGHPSGYWSAAALAYLIAEIYEGQGMEIGVQHTIFKLETVKDGEECIEKLQLAMALAKGNASDREAIMRIGQGWVGEEALGIAVYASLKHQDDFLKGIIAAVNHDGDSDSTGAITGNILGLYLGLDGIADEWIDGVELKDEIFQISDDLIKRFADNEAWLKRYPGH
jgi:ADP-ribosylglycohydrolase